jgi:hypothetical protein
MPEWLRDSWHWLLGIIFAAGGGWSLLESSKRRLNVAFRRLDEERDERMRSVAEEKEERQALGQSLMIAIAEMRGDQRHTTDELSRLGHEQVDRMTDIAQQIRKIDSKMDELHSHDKRLAVLEEKVAQIYERGCGLQCPDPRPRGAA